MHKFVDIYDSILYAFAADERRGNKICCTNKKQGTKFNNRALPANLAMNKKREDSLHRNRYLENKKIQKVWSLSHISTLTNRILQRPIIGRRILLRK